jgi:hypothetical protein
MTVKELIEELKKYPAKYTIQINSKTAGFSEDILKVERDMNEEEYQYIDIIGE